MAPTLELERPEKNHEVVEPVPCPRLSSSCTTSQSHKPSKEVAGWRVTARTPFRTLFNNTLSVTGLQTCAAARSASTPQTATRRPRLSKWGSHHSVAPFEELISGYVVGRHTTAPSSRQSVHDTKKSESAIVKAPKQLGGPSRHHVMPVASTSRDAVGGHLSAIPALSQNYHGTEESEPAEIDESKQQGLVLPHGVTLSRSYHDTKETVLSSHYHEYAYSWGVSETAPVYSRLHMYFEKSCDLFPNKAAVEFVDVKLKLTYHELDQRANQLAHFLRDRYDVNSGSRVCIFLSRSVDMYVSLLAVLKCNAAYVPMDPSFPAERLGFMVQDSGSSLLLTTSSLALAVEGKVNCAVLVLDLFSTSIFEQSGSRLALGDSTDTLCYIIYTSGTTGKPKGVCIDHSSICNFISVVVPLYGVSQHDRVYQGITIAFDFSIEEIWPTFAVGATLLAGPTDDRKLGSELAKILHETETTVLHCVPTLLSTIDRNLPYLKIINVGGEACSEELVKRWTSPDRSLLNTYGPTETTVTASLAFLTPGRPVNIGRPLPTYTMYILDEKQQPVRNGEVGEIYIGGKGVSNGYLNRPDKTEAAFHLVHVDSPDHGEQTEHLFRTGDIGRLTWRGEIEIKGRMDDQVKIRGYRLELSEIEAVIQGKIASPQQSIC